MKNKDPVEIVADFGEDFGFLAKQDIAQMFLDIHASFSSLDPLMVKAIQENEQMN
jgi:hypothetical protein